MRPLPVVNEHVCVRFGDNPHSYEPAKWVLCFNTDPNASSARVYSFEAESTKIGRSITHVGLSEYRNSLNLRLPLPVADDPNSIEVRKRKLDELAAFFPGATHAEVFTPRENTPALRAVYREPRVLPFPAPAVAA